MPKKKYDEIRTHEGAKLRPEDALFLRYLETHDISISHPDVSYCPRCDHSIGGGLCTKRHWSRISLTKESFAYKDDPKFPNLHCLNWRIRSPKKDQPGHEGTIPLAEITHEAKFENILPKDNFISQYLKLGTSMNDAYPEYHFVCALTIIATIIQRKLYLEFTTRLYPNIFSIFLGDSTTSRKTTALNMMKRILAQSVHFYPDEFSAPAIIDEMSEIGHGLFHIDEYGDFLAKMSRDYNSGIPNFLCKIFDCPPFYRKRLRKERFIINNAYPNLIGGIQPVVFTKYTEDTDMATGYPARTLWVYPTRPKKTKPLQELSKEHIASMIKLHERVKSYAVSFSGINSKMRISLSSDSLTKYNDWASQFEKILVENQLEDLLSSVIGRLKDYALKLAVIFTVADPEFFKILNTLHKTIEKHNNPDSEEEQEIIQSLMGDMTNKFHSRNIFIVPDSYVDMAIHYIEKIFFPFAQKTTKKIIEDRKANLITSVYEIIVKNQGISRTKLCRWVGSKGVRAKELDEILETLENGDLVERILDEQKTKYYALDPDKEEINTGEERK